ncbi:hypothetical protein B0H10DRAFT_2193526 [Mycena sp. CBHHK59/15]|nr:hypothetical protein B0H10DRAFT_2193526 [Mycena sp. CBHHK59/15]
MPNNGSMYYPWVVGSSAAWHAPPAVLDPSIESNGPRFRQKKICSGGLFESLRLLLSILEQSRLTSVPMLSRSDRELVSQMDAQAQSGARLARLPEAGHARRRHMKSCGITNTFDPFPPWSLPPFFLAATDHNLSVGAMQQYKDLAEERALRPDVMCARSPWVGRPDADPDKIWGFGTSRPPGGAKAWSKSRQNRGSLFQSRQNCQSQSRQIHGLLTYNSESSQYAGARWGLEAYISVKPMRISADSRSTSTEHRSPWEKRETLNTTRSLPKLSVGASRRQRFAFPSANPDNVSYACFSPHTRLFVGVKLALPKVPSRRQGDWRAKCSHERGIPISHRIVQSQHTESECISKGARFVAKRLPRRWWMAGWREDDDERRNTQRRENRRDSRGERTLTYTFTHVPPWSASAVPQSCIRQRRDTATATAAVTTTTTRYNCDAEKVDRVGAALHVHTVYTLLVVIWWRCLGTNTRTYIRIGCLRLSKVDQGGGRWGRKALEFGWTRIQHGEAYKQAPGVSRVTQGGGSWVGKHIDTIRGMGTKARDPPFGTDTVNGDMRDDYSEIRRRRIGNALSRSSFNWRP